MRGDDDVLDSSPSKEARSCLMLISGHLLCLLREQEQSADSLGRSNSPGREQAEPPHEGDVEPHQVVHHGRQAQHGAMCERHSRSVSIIPAIPGYRL